ncbi:hypothetical protein [Vulgatibacter incomptus]|uniref:Phosphate-selective porin O and P n=1 Tax=Vulgatibacter incomptus TaxID=1391653 RepID=A0A0K1PF13_9BACT|nr:hypothetical protein [Vulgatibacter incomptus]AKU92097.1 phosphate-selective porin O and P [Vulgatibacter incomptus]
MSLPLKKCPLLLLAVFAASPAAAEPASASNLRVGGYLQSQYEHHQDSEDQLGQDGKPLNSDRFLVRRARLQLAGEWDWAGAIVELDGNTASGGFRADLHRAEATLRYVPEGSKAPLLDASIGAITIPFGFELVESDRMRPFMERSLVVRSFFPGSVDLGARVGGKLDWFDWSVAVMNGQPKAGSVDFSGSAPAAAKDLLIRVGMDSGPETPFRISGHVSTLAGKGFHAGSPATKARVEWRDLNEDGIAQPYEYTAIPGRAATPSETYGRWAVGADVQLAYRTDLGNTRVLGEAILGQNLDRLLFANDPVVTGLDARGFGYYLAVIQDLGRYALAGLRYDSYDPDANVFDNRKGKLEPASMRIDSIAPMVGLVLPDVASLTFEYDFVRNKLARDESGMPTNRPSDAWTLRLQVQL